MKIAIFGATGAVGGECLTQSLEAGHEVKVLVRSANKLADDMRSRVEVLEGNALDKADVEKTLEGTEAVMFAIGVDKHSPEDLCTDVTRHILEVMRARGGGRLIWCGGGSTFFEEDQITLGARFVRFFASTFMGLRHRDKEHQMQLLKQYDDIDWIGVRPLQIKKGPKTASYLTGFNTFSGASWISFADVGHAMLSMLNDDSWVRKAPIIRY